MNKENEEFVNEIDNIFALIKIASYWVIVSFISLMMILGFLFLITEFKQNKTMALCNSGNFLGNVNCIERSKSKPYTIHIPKNAYFEGDRLIWGDAVDYPDKVELIFGGISDELKANMIKDIRQFDGIEIRVNQ